MTKPHPPKPRLTFRMGITGHRPNKLVGADARLRDGMSNLFRTIQEELESVRAANPDVIADEPPQLRAVTALAEGSDQLFAQAAAGLGIPVFAPLPFLKDEYEKDFAEEKSRAAFRKLLGQATVFALPHERRDADTAYENVGLFMLRQSDLIVTVWDGQPGSGRGGTVDILQHALRAGIPIVRFFPDGDGPWVLSSGKAAPDSSLFDLARKSTLADAQKLGEIVRAIVTPPSEKVLESDEEGSPLVLNEQRKRLRTFLRESEQRRNYWFAYPAMQRLLTSWRGFRRCLSPQPYIEGVHAEWRRYFWTSFAGVDEASTIDRETLARGAPQGVLGLLEERYAWADRRAVHLAQVYRSSYVFIFMLGALTVACALLPVIWDVKPYSSVVELLLIGTAAAIVIIGNLSAWHRRWLDYRQLAEQLRVLRLLALTGSSVARFRVEHADAGSSSLSWTDWYLRATVREIAMPQGTADGDYAMAIRRALVDSEIGSQISFHEKNEKRQESMEHWLDRLGLSLFVATAAILIAHLGIEASGEHLSPWTSDLTMFLSAVFPTFGAALFAIRVQGDFDESARMSKEMQTRLKLLRADIPASKATNFAFMSSAVEEAASALTADLSDWRLLYRGKPLTLAG